MSEKLLNKVINGKISFNEFLRWLSQPHEQDAISPDYQCSPRDFVTYFLNFVHEEIGSEKKSENETTKSSSEINKSHSFPLDLSSETDEVTNSTPKVTRVSSDSLLGYMSPISPIYKHSSFSTPKTKSSLCLGDFIINKSVSSKKKSSRRIKPTNLNQNEINSFHKSENSFDFNETDEFSEFVVDEKFKILSRSVGTPAKLPSFSGEIRPEITSVNHKKEIEKIVEIYTTFLDKSYLNLTSEIYFLLTLLLKKQYYTSDWGIDVLTEKITAPLLFTSIHNIVFFASQTLTKLIKVLRNYDNSTIRVLTENERLREFAPTLVTELQKVCKPDRIIEVLTTQSNICFNLDTDNRQNFPNDLSFHAFRKQRDLFYEILRLYEVHHLAQGFNYTISLGGKIKTLFSLSNEATNYVHFARLFKSQLLNTCSSSDDLLVSLDVDAQKLSKLKSRCVTKGHCQGLNSVPIFTENEDFYKEFILVAANYCFNRHFSDILIQEIIELNENIAEDDLVTKKSYYSCLKSLRTLAKFLGFVESLPYKTDSNYSDNLLSTHVKIRSQKHPSFDIKSTLDTSIRRKSVILCVPWVVKYLSMLDFVTLRLPYYCQVQANLSWIYRNFDWGPEPNIFLVKFCLGWLFELPHFPENCYIERAKENSLKTCLDALDVVDQDILYFCCPYLNEIKRLLSATPSNHSISVKHITPVTAQSHDELARKKLEQQLQEAFFNGQPVSLRKTVEFVSERVASTCVKHICHVLVPKHKKQALEKLKSITSDDLETQKTILKTKANQLASDCLKELKKVCDEEITKISEPKIAAAVGSLVSLDILPQTLKVCVGITGQMCRERVAQWVESHVTLGVFMKDFNDEIHSLGCKKPKKPVFMLPPGGTNTNHNENTTSPAHLLEKYRALTVEVVEKRHIGEDRVTSILDDTSKSIRERGDFNQCILATICTQILDLMVLLLAHERSVVSNVVLEKSCDIWRLYYNGCDNLFKLLLSPRNVTIFSKSNEKKATWDAFANFCEYLMKNKLLSCEVFETQCTGIFKTDWDQETLKLITEFFKTFGRLYREQGGSASDFTFLLDFFSDYCQDLF